MGEAFKGEVFMGEAFIGEDFMGEVIMGEDFIVAFPVKPFPLSWEESGSGRQKEIFDLESPDSLIVLGRKQMYWLPNIP